MKRNVNWTEKDLDKALNRIVKDQDFHARQQEFRQKAEARRQKQAAAARGKGKRAKPPKGPRKPDVTELAIKAFTGYEVTPEHKFHATRGWRFDYAIVELRIAIEQDGGIWREGGGAHSSPKAILRDMEKTTEAQLHGWVVLRLTPEEMNTDKMWRWLDLAIELQKSRNF